MQKGARKLKKKIKVAYKIEIYRVQVKKLVVIFVVKIHPHMNCNKIIIYNLKIDQGHNNKIR